MTTFIQDVRFAIRQLRRTPVFTLTVLLTLALGIGANAAIFTLVNAVLLNNLPVSDPKMLVRLGDNTNCCVTSGTSDNGDYTLFSTNTYQELKKNTPEFEELAAMQAGFAYRPITACRLRGCRRGGRYCLPERAVQRDSDVLRADDATAVAYEGPD
jgi:hypothetical protein